MIIKAWQLETMLEMVNRVSETLLNDKNFERSTHVRKNLDSFFKSYRHILTDKWKQCKQTSLKDYFSKK